MGLHGRIWSVGPYDPPITNHHTNHPSHDTDLGWEETVDLVQVELPPRVIHLGVAPLRLLCVYGCGGV